MAERLGHTATLTWTDANNPSGTTYNVYRASVLQGVMKTEKAEEARSMTPEDLARDQAYVRPIAARLVPLYLREDATQEGLIALQEARAKGVAEHVVVKRRIIDFYRRETHQGKQLYQHLDRDDVLAQSAKDVGQSYFEALTDRQMQVLELYKQKLSAKAIAAELHMSPKTVHVHLRAVRTKLGLIGVGGNGKAAREITAAVADRQGCIGTSRAIKALMERLVRVESWIVQHSRENISR